MKFRKKPVVISAVQYNGTNIDAIESFVGKENMTYKLMDPKIPAIKTLEGELTISKGDWIIRGVKNEFYPCKPEIFAATYEPAE